MPLQGVHHHPGRLLRPEVLLQEGQDHQLLNRLLQVQNHQINPPPEIKAEGKIIRNKRRKCRAFPSLLNIVKFGNR
jgi:plasmid maintenance system antidote protein VapI